MLKMSITSQTLKNLSPTLLEETFDVLVIGAGIIGTAIARTLLLKKPSLKIALLEKEDKPGKHQSSHNSGVIHSGFYYKPNSLKAQLCVKGSRMILDYCREKNIKFVQCGKLLLANSRCEIQDLQVLYKRGLENEVQGLELWKNKGVIESFQPGSVGVQALWSPETGNVNWMTVTEHFLEDFLGGGGRIFYNFKVDDVEDSEFLFRVQSSDKVVTSRFLVCCPGINSEEIAKIIQDSSPEKHVSFRVQYLLLQGKSTEKIKTNVYEIPDLEAPFLGVHFSPTPEGDILLGPSAVPALTREGYSSSELNLDYIKKIASYKGFQMMTLRNFTKCVNQVAKTFCPEIQHRELQKLVSSLELEEMKPGPIAVQTQLIDPNGRFVDDFKFDFFEAHSRIINCKFLPSPAASSSMAIGDLVSQKLLEKI